MEKRLILAIALSFLILLSWSALVSKSYHVGKQDVTETKADLAASKPMPASQPAVALEAVLPEPALPSILSMENWDLALVDATASLKEVEFKGARAYKFPLISGLLLADKTLDFKKQAVSKNVVVFVHSGPQYNIIKKFTFHNLNYTIELDINVQNQSKTPLTFSAPLILGQLDFSSNDVNSRYQDVAVATQDKTAHFNGRKNMEFQNIKFLAIRDRYFCAIIEPEQKTFSAFISKLDSERSQIGLSQPATTLNPGEQINQKFLIYLGPQQLQRINSINPAWSAVIYFGTFDFISQMLLQLLQFLFNIVRNWGLAIILLSLSVYLILYPLTLKQMRSMKEMQILQPKIEALRKAYKDNPQKLNKEIMELYREHKVNPLGGCLPLLLQMPIFFALYQALMRSVVLRGARFLWIKDLSEPDRLFLLPTSLPVIGNEFNILPIVMAIGMFVQQKFSMAATPTTSAAEQQKIMLIIMPIMFGFIFYHMPAGLVLYWFVNSALMLVYQIRISKAK